MTKNLFLTYIFSTVFITMIMQSKFNDFALKNLVKYLSSDESIKINLQINLQQINDYDDFSSGWYLDVGYQIYLTWILLTITPPVLIVTYYYPFEWICKILAKKQLLHRKMEEYLVPEEF